MLWKPEAANLDETQREVIKKCLETIQNKKGTHRVPWISGFAGNGKSVVLVHVMEQLADLDKSASIAFITYTHALKDLVKLSLLPRHRNRISVVTHKNFLSDKSNFDYVFLDEIQDISSGDMLKIKKLASRLILAGDFAQTIYPANSPMDETDFHALFLVEEHKLMKMFRLTKKVAEIVGKLLGGKAFIYGLQPGKTKEVPVRLIKHQSQEGEFRWLWNEASSFSQPQNPSVILFPFHEDIMEFANFVATELSMNGRPPERKKTFKGPESDPYEDFNKFFSNMPGSIKLQFYGSGSGSNALEMSQQKKVVFLMTYHSSKGLDFRTVFVPMLNDDRYLAAKKIRDADSQIENKLLFVATTRSREGLFLSYSTDEPHKLVADLDLTPIELDTDNDY